MYAADHAGHEVVARAVVLEHGSCSWAADSSCTAATSGHQQPQRVKLYDPKYDAYARGSDVMDARIYHCLISTTDQEHVSFADVVNTSNLPVTLANQRTFTIAGATNATLDFANLPRIIHVANGSKLVLDGVRSGGFTVRGVPSRLTALPWDQVPLDPTGLLIFPAVTADVGAQVCGGFAGVDICRAVVCASYAMVSTVLMCSPCHTSPQTSFSNLLLEFPFSSCTPEMLAQVIAAFNRVYNTTSMQLQDGLLVMPDKLDLQLAVLDRANAGQRMLLCIVGIGAVLVGGLLCSMITAHVMYLLHMCVP